MIISAEDFRIGMRHLAAGVCIVTARAADGTRSGFAATAVCSVSADPPTLLVCAHRENGSYDVIRNAGHFAVNILGEEDRELSNRFASAIVGDARFDRGAWTQLASGAPILESALASFDCRLVNCIDGGSHSVMFGEIGGLRLGAGNSAALLYAHGDYGVFAPLRHAPLED